MLVPNQVYLCTVNVFGLVEGRILSFTSSCLLSVTSYDDALRQAYVVVNELSKDLKFDPDGPKTQVNLNLIRMSASELMTFTKIALTGEEQEQWLLDEPTPPVVN